MSTSQFPWISYSRLNLSLFLNGILDNPTKLPLPLVLLFEHIASISSQIVTQNLEFTLHFSSNLFTSITAHTSPVSSTFKTYLSPSAFLHLYHRYHSPSISYLDSCNTFLTYTDKVFSFVQSNVFMILFRDVISVLELGILQTKSTGSYKDLYNI